MGQSVARSAIESEYRKKTPASYKSFKQMGTVMPGVAKGAYFYSPYPITVRHAEGCYITDVDNNEYIDFANHHTAQVLGHNHPAVREAVEQQIKKGIAVAAPMGIETELAEEICRRVDSVDSLRFCNSGTEATLHAIRLAREYTGRHLIAKFEGGYHGSHDAVEISVAPDLSKAGPVDGPLSVPSAGGMPPNATDNVIVLPYDDEESVERIIAEHVNEIACVLLDPKTGILPQRPEFIKAVREITRRHDVLLIYDEIVGFRAAYGGSQAVYGVTPDLTTFGKIIGGGFPVGAFGGRKDLMALLDPTGGQVRLFQSGTFSGHPIAMAAGLAVLTELNDKVFAHLNHITNRLENGLQRVFAKLGISGQTICSGSTFSIYFSESPVRTYRDAAKSDKTGIGDLFLGLLNRGYYPGNGLGMCCLSLPMNETHIDGIIDAVESVLKQWNKS